MAKAAREKIQLRSTGTNKKGKPTGYFVTTKKNKRGEGKLKLKKYDPRAYNTKTGKLGKHVEFVEDKIKG
ncbi:MAG: 50S ribosomal protein L33 [Gammaproteobacteria bacterium]|nr:50S ribosomal protein L33 [Gammaproteobacteria bacterium]